MRRLSGSLVVLLVSAVAVAEPPNRIEVGFQGGWVFDSLAFGPQVSFDRRLASRGRFDLLAGTTQVYRMTPFFDAPAQLGAGTSRRAYRHYHSALVGPGVSLRLPPADRLLLGLEVLAGVTYFHESGRYTSSEFGIDRSYSAAEAGGTVGARLSISYRVGCRWSLLGSIWQPVLEPPLAPRHLGLGFALVF